MPKTKEQYEQIKLERKKSIFCHSLYLFALHGYDGVTTDDITKASGCSHGLLYHYFGSKDELFQTVVDRASTILDDITKDVNFNQQPKFLLQDLLDSYLKALNSPRNDYACTIYLLSNLYIQSRNMPKAKQQKFKFGIFSTILETIEKGKSEGVFIDYSTIELTVTLISILKGVSYNRINLGYKKCTIPRSELLMRLVIKNL